MMVYFFGGGFVAGDGSEPRYDGESMAAKGIVAVTVNYRLGVFGFLAHPELTKESPHHASGNYALLDQHAALQWVQQNIAAFGGDPRKVTIAGESAGSISVSAQMASPLVQGPDRGRDRRKRLDPGRAAGRAAGGRRGGRRQVRGQSRRVEHRSHARDAYARRSSRRRAKQGAPRFGPVVDGYFFPEPPAAIFAAGKQAHVPLLAGWNSEEMNARSVLAREEATPENLKKAIDRLYGEHGAEVNQEYAAANNDEARALAAQLASARFIAYSTWKWIDLAAKTGGKPVFRYYYSRPRPAMSAQMGNATAGLAGGVVRGNGSAPPPPAPTGAVHSSEIEYALGNLGTNKTYAWTPDDYKVSKAMEQYFANFIKTGNPNGAGLPKWMAAKGGDPVQYMQIDVDTRAQTDQHPGRYTVLDKLAK